MSSKRKQYTEEFKESAVKLITEQGYSASEAARNLGINYTMLCRWKRKYESKQPEPDGSMSKYEMEQELKKLRKENNRLKQEREILKKATVFFAQEQGNGMK